MIVYSNFRLKREFLFINRDFNYLKMMFQCKTAQVAIATWMLQWHYVPKSDLNRSSTKKLTIEVKPLQSNPNCIISVFSKTCHQSNRHTAPLTTNTHTRARDSFDQQCEGRNFQLCSIS